MLFNTNLEEIIFHRHETVLSNELIVLSGYLGPNPIARLENLPLNSTVIYGMYGDRGIQERLHQALIYHQINIPNVNIYYSTVPIHSKCYIWKNQNQIQHALIGSANFSTNGLTTPYREILAETTHDTFQPLQEYIDNIIEIIWDDGTTMDGLLEGSQKENGIIYPKQISSAPKKSLMGEYIRYRLNLPLGTKITKKDLENYGRTTIDVSLQDEGIYYFDFSV